MKSPEARKISLNKGMQKASDMPSIVLIIWRRRRRSTVKAFKINPMTESCAAAAEVIWRAAPKSSKSDVGSLSRRAAVGRSSSSGSQNVRLGAAMYKEEEGGERRKGGRRQAREKANMPKASPSEASKTATIWQSARTHACHHGGPAGPFFCSLSAGGVAAYVAGASCCPMCRKIICCMLIVASSLIASHCNPAAFASSSCHSIFDAVSVYSRQRHLFDGQMEQARRALADGAASMNN